MNDEEERLKIYEILGALAAQLRGVAENIPLIQKQIELVMKVVDAQKEASDTKMKKLSVAVTCLESQAKACRQMQHLFASTVLHTQRWVM